MSYQVLARKWRPKTFQDMVGQEHVLKALVHALDHQRLHHAYLFTGTRGVGKTTIGRLLARCLNCETGITSNPCGECDTCQEVLGGRFVDLIEIDAASRTKVEDMRELLDNVQYAPTRGRFKIYLIDEVHMLSNSSFNALLKTLEEPPDHVKFLFATTDPQKLPVTILSRCLQFNLKRMTPEHIVGHLNHVLTEETIPYEEPALWLLARAADGSMRDALSLTDQAIAFGNQKLAASDVSAMLGTIDQRDIQRIVEALVKGDGPGMLSEVNRIAEFAPDYSVILSDLLSLFHRVTLEQVVPGSADNAMGDADQVKAVAKQLSAEDAQLFYQAALIGRKDLAITPDARMGFEMALLRMLTFRPGSDRRDPPAAANGGAQGQGGIEPRQDDPEPAPATQVNATAPQPENAGESNEVQSASQEPPAAAAPTAPVSEPVTPAPQSEAPTEPAPQPQPVAPQSASNATTVDETPETSSQPDDIPLSAYDDPSLTADGDDDYDIGQGDADPVPVNEAPSIEDSQPSPDAIPGADDARPINENTVGTQPEAAAESAAKQPEQPQSSPVAQAEPQPATEKGTGEGDTVSPADFEWQRDFRALKLSGMAGNLASQAAFRKDGQSIVLTLDSGHARLLTDRHKGRIAEACSTYFGEELSLQVEEGEPGPETPAAFAERARIARQQAAESAIADDPIVQNIVNRFEGTIVEGSIEPV
ncbi:DNA polymerase III subunit gamma/tau [Marinobacter nanhaiticus D15-8W]|uniref:DNA polymerase III subunit gamma/tau n=1 Tax=Marinobacter nanhaiticus D15-8W TaxID=626887 RepID=N6WRW2_9GAMM|nr:DNA polymerase III subunit gamma/tau [Marinobacter nanhaiticus]ENO14276.1 DNA polymerase III subunit gamma/tau [Marinobacter nanhaiticus D15-8W]BES71664.1 DNA polymerase III subunit gamma/tau [Marinobacter nanhaiticus D15-8W]